MIVANKPLPSYPLPQRRQVAPPIQKRRAKVSAKPLLRLAAVLLVAVALSFTLIWRQAQIVSTNRNINKLKADVAALEASNALLQLDVARLSSSSRIEAIARNELHMERPVESQIMKVGVSGGN